MPKPPSAFARTARVVSLAILLWALDGAPAAAPHRERHAAERPPPAATPGPRAPQDDGLALSGPRRIGLNNGWRFFRGDVEGAERPEYADGTWRLLDIPHDWAIEGPFAEAHGPGAGALPSYGAGWYRKRFQLPADASGKRVAVEFDGAMANARVWLNGQELGTRPYGYSGFGFDLTPHLRAPGEQNVLAVRLSPERDASRWYPGAGLYRHVWLDVTSPVHVARWGTYVTTPAVSDELALVRVQSGVRNATSRAVTLVAETVVLDPAGVEVARSAGAPLALAAGGTGTTTSELRVRAPERWDVERPVLYRAITTLRGGTREIDRVETPFGIRTIAFAADRGFVLNGRPLKLQGVNLHHDLGALGAAVHPRAIERQLRLMRAMGANAVRTSHNPPAPELLDLTDRLGLLVIDEAFDMWQRTKVPNGHGKYFAEWGERDLRDMVRRDRNHPSVILWSIGNEVLEQSDPEGGRIAARLAAICKEEDPTRPVTIGLNQFENALKNGLAAAVDVPGFNYQTRHYDRLRAEHPGWTFYTAESASTVSSRGVYHLPVEKYHKHPTRQITSYDVIAPRWAYVPDFEFAAQERMPHVAGEFVWTGFDYLGEPTPYYGWREPPDANDWPARSSYFGLVDLAGFPKDRYYLYQSVWTRTPMVHVLPHWNWAGHEGETIPVLAYTNGEEAELFLDGTTLGRKRRGTDRVTLPVGDSVNDSGTFHTPYRLRWDVPYRPGTLRLVAYRGGRVVAEKVVHTAGPPARVRLVAERARLTADGRDLTFIVARIEDAQGRLCPRASHTLRFTLKGPGVIAGVDNGDPQTTAPFQADHRDAFNGLALVIVRSAGRTGSIAVMAASAGLASGSVTVEAVANGTEW